MKKFIKSIKKLFARKLVVINTQENQYHVIHVEKDTESIIEGLGMTEERARHFEKLIAIAYMDHNDTISVIVQVSKECKHANELFFCTTMVTHRLRDNMGPSGLLRELLGKRRD